MKSAPYTPPFSITEKMIHLVAEISEMVGSITAWQHMNASPQPRRDSRIRTIHATLAIENNTLSIDQVTDVINGKHVLGAPREIREVKNAYSAYEQLLTLNPYSAGDLLQAHAILMADLVEDAGHFRSGGVGIFKGNRVVHIAPPPDLVQEQIKSLLQWVETTDSHPLIKSSVFHYEFEFIHPFADGNGRMGRMWNTLLLASWKSIFAWIPIETIIRERQEAYYSALSAADSTGMATPFIEFLLLAILDTLKAIERHQRPMQAIEPKLRLLLDKMGNEALSGTEIMHRMGLKNRPSFLTGYLHPAIEQGLIEMTLPDKPSSKNQTYRRRTSG